MPYPIEDKPVIAVSSSALFDMQASDAIFKQEGKALTENINRIILTIRLEKVSHFLS